MILRKIIPFLLIICLIFIQLGDLVTRVSFEINQNYISKNLCENRLNPVSLCHGSCYLKKQIKKNRENSQTYVQKTLKILAIYVNPVAISPVEYTFYLQNLDYTNYTILFRPTLGIFHPPCICS